MPEKAALFSHEGDQAVKLPEHCRFDGNEVLIRRDTATGNIILSEKTTCWDSFFALRAEADVPEDFLLERDDSPPQQRSRLS